MVFLVIIGGGILRHYMRGYSLTLVEWVEWVEDLLVLPVMKNLNYSYRDAYMIEHR